MITDSPHRWFGEMVTDDLADLERQWVGEGAVAARDWLRILRQEILSGI